MAGELSEEEWSADLDKKDVKELLTKWRDENSRNPQKCRDLWLRFDLDKYLGDEKWPVIEQVFLSAMDLHDSALIKECITQLDAQFPGSSRVKRLKTMARMEVRERYDDALKVYDEMIKADESNSILYKRKIAILISQKKIGEAIKELVEYLKKFMNDQEGWLELADLYIQEQEYTKAAFCMEELILVNPHNHLYHERYAEIQYTINTGESLELARSYYAQALKLNPTNMRALFGIYLTANNLSTQPKATSQKKKENQRLAAWALAQINKSYSEQDNADMVGSLDSLMSNLNMNSV
jgi:tetratricopeptide (TPR) repeat protein